jgi:hypothetical protein
MTYHQYSPTLGYVQGMSDLLSPIYVVFEADEASSFWAFVGWMKVIRSQGGRMRFESKILSVGNIASL